LVGKMSTVMEKLRAKTQYQLAICDLGFSGLVNPKIVNRLLKCSEGCLGFWRNNP